MPREARINPQGDYLFSGINLPSLGTYVLAVTLKEMPTVKMAKPYTIKVVAGPPHRFKACSVTATLGIPEKILLKAVDAHDNHISFFDTFPPTIKMDKLNPPEIGTPVPRAVIVLLTYADMVMSDVSVDLNGNLELDITLNGTLTAKRCKAELSIGGANGLAAQLDIQLKPGTLNATPHSSTDSLRVTYKDYMPRGSHVCE